MIGHEDELGKEKTRRCVRVTEPIEGNGGWDEGGHERTDHADDGADKAQQTRRLDERGPRRGSVLHRCDSFLYG